MVSIGVGGGKRRIGLGESKKEGRKGIEGDKYTLYFFHFLIVASLYKPPFPPLTHSITDSLT